MSKGKPKVPPSKVPIIGQSASKPQGQEIVEAIMAQLRPVIDSILTAIDGLERRVAVVEEVKQVFPSCVRVIIEHKKDKMVSEGGGDTEVKK